MRNILLVLMLVVGVVGCRATFYEDEYVAFPSGEPEYGCAIIHDDFGEREVCDVNYYVVNGSVIYFDPYFHYWIGPRGYWVNSGIYHYGFFEGYHSHYGSYYHSFGWHAQHGWYDHHPGFRGGARGNPGGGHWGYGGGVRGGGGGHGGGHGGHR